MKQTETTRKLAQEAQDKIATILQTEISDPRLDMVTVTGCEVSVDKTLCRVYVSADPDKYDEVMAGLESAKGRIRSILGRSLDWRVMPELEFVIDKSADHAMRITEALKDVPSTMSVPKDENGYPIKDEKEYPAPDPFEEENKYANGGPLSEEIAEEDEEDCKAHWNSEEANNIETI